MVDHLTLQLNKDFFFLVCYFLICKYQTQAVHEQGTLIIMNNIYMKGGYFDVAKLYNM